MENEETDPLLEHEEKDDDDDDDDDTTHPFQPDVHSTPGPSGEEIPMTTMNREKEKGSGIAETSFIEGSTHSRVLELDKKAWESLTGIFPEVKATELEATYSKRGKLQVKMFGQGKRAYSFVYKRQRYRRTKVESNSPETNKICSWTRARHIDCFKRKRNRGAAGIHSRR